MRVWGLYECNEVNQNLTHVSFRILKNEQAMNEKKLAEIPKSIEIISAKMKENTRSVCENLEDKVKIILEEIVDEAITKEVYKLEDKFKILLEEKLCTQATALIRENAQVDTDKVTFHLK